MAKGPDSGVLLSEVFCGRFPERLVQIIDSEQITIKEYIELENDRPNMYVVLTDQGLYFSLTGRIRWRLRWAKIATAIASVLGVIWAFLKYFSII